MLMRRTLTALTLTTSLLVYGNLLSGSRVVFYLPWIFKFPAPEIWRFFTPFWVTGPNISILLDTYFCKFHLVMRMLSAYTLLVWTYSSALEKDSPRFSQPGDFLTYIIFLGLFILVCHILSSCILFEAPLFSQLSFLLMPLTSYICPPSQYLAEAVPENEEDYPCISRWSVIRNQS